MVQQHTKYYGRLQPLRSIIVHSGENSCRSRPSSYSKRRRLPLLFQQYTTTRHTPHWWRQQGRPSCRHYSASSVSAAGAAPSFNLDPSTGLVFRDGDGKKPSQARFQTIIGLEIHAQLDIPTKLFSPAPTTNSKISKPNSHLHPFDLAVPGTLPVLSKEATHSALIAAVMLQCQIQPISRFERKHYTYADLPHHYQITQQRWPLARNGIIQVWDSSGGHPKRSKKKKKKNAGNNKDTTDATKTTPIIQCRINRIQLEQDTAKTTTSTQANTDITMSRVDFDRAGQALIEIVTEPDLKTPREASEVTETIRSLLQHSGICNGRMEDGSLRCDVNVNIEQIINDDDDEGNSMTPQRSPRVEVKNLNSIRQVREAVEYEVLRQAKEWQKRQDAINDDDDDDDPSTMPQQEQFAETRTWNPSTRRTVLIRQKNEEQDYRFMPEPDLPPLVLGPSVLDGMDLETFIQTNRPELPHETIVRLQSQYGISEYQATVLVGDPPSIAFLEESLEVTRRELAASDNGSNESLVATATTNVLTNHLFALVKESAAVSHEDGARGSVQDSHVSAQQLGQVITLLVQGTISKSMANSLITLLYTEKELWGSNPALVAKARGMQLISDPAELRQICLTVIDEHPEEMDVYRQGGKFKIKITKLFAGKAMASCRGNADPERLRDILARVLEEQC